MNSQPLGGIMQEIAEEIIKGDRRRYERAAVAWATLRPYERRIVKEAAVMGYVLGYRFGIVQGRSNASPLTDTRDFPGDPDIVVSVLQHCDTSDGYPYLAAACSGRRRRITRKRLWPGETP